MRDSPKHYPPPPPLPPPLPTGRSAVQQPDRQQVSGVAVAPENGPSVEERKRAAQRCWLLVATSLLFLVLAWPILLVLIPIHLYLLCRIGTFLRWSQARILLTCIPAAVPAFGAVYAVVTAVVILFAEFRRWLYDDSSLPSTNLTTTDAEGSPDPDEVILKRRLRFLASVVTVLILLGKLFFSLGGREWLDGQRKGRAQPFKPVRVIQ